MFNPRVFDGRASYGVASNICSRLGRGGGEGWGDGANMSGPGETLCDVAGDIYRAIPPL